MAWLTEAELQARWAPAVINRLAERATAEETAAAIAQAIASAEAAAREMLLERYGPEHLPATPETTPAGLKDLVADLVPLRLAQSSGFDHMSDDLVGATERALLRLRSIARGQADLGLSSHPEVDQSADMPLGSRPREPAVTRETLRSW